MPHALAGLLIATRRASPAAVEEALHRQVLAGGTLDTALLETAGAPPEPALLSALAEASRTPPADASALAAADRSLSKLLPARLAERHCILPLSAEGRVVHVAVAYPVNQGMLQEIGFLLGRELRPHVSLEARLREALQAVYGIAIPPRHAAVLAALSAARPPARTQEKAPAAAPAQAPAPRRENPPPSASRLEGTTWADQIPWAGLVSPEPNGPRAAPGQQQAPALDARTPAATFRTPAAQTVPDAPPASETETPIAVHLSFGPPPPTPPSLAQPSLASAQERAPSAPLPAEGAATAAPIGARPEPAHPDREPAPVAHEAAHPPLARGPTPLHQRVVPHVDGEEMGLAQRVLALAGEDAPPSASPDDLTLWSARRALAAATDRHQLIDVALCFALRIFDFAGAFAVVGGNAIGWTAQSRYGPRDPRIETITLPLDAPSVLNTVVTTRGRFLGPTPDDPLSRELVRAMGREPCDTAFFCPVEVRGRVIAILYGDLDGRPPSEARIAELLVLVQFLGQGFERLILEQKRRAEAAGLPFQHSVANEPETRRPSSGGLAATRPVEPPAASKTKARPKTDPIPVIHFNPPRRAARPPPAPPTPARALPSEDDPPGPEWLLVGMTPAPTPVSLPAPEGPTAAPLPDPRAPIALTETPITVGPWEIRSDPPHPASASDKEAFAAAPSGVPHGNAAEPGSSQPLAEPRAASEVAESRATAAEASLVEPFDPLPGDGEEVLDPAQAVTAEVPAASQPAPADAGAAAAGAPEASQPAQPALAETGMTREKPDLARGNAENTPEPGGERAAAVTPASPGFEAGAAAGPCRQAASRQEARAGEPEPATSAADAQPGGSDSAARLAPEPAFRMESPSPASAQTAADRPGRPTPPPLPPPAAKPAATKTPGALAPPQEQAGDPAGMAPVDPLQEVIRRLLSTDLAARAEATVELSRTPEASARALAASFPGPVLLTRVPVSDLPAPEEIGPVPAALARLGEPAAAALLPLLESLNADTRYFAVLTAGHIPSATLLKPLAERAFDRLPTVASAARAALARLSGLPGHAQIVQGFRAALAGKDPALAAGAARALGRLHDVGSVERLIALTGSQSKPLAEAAADALRELCKQAFGLSPKQWQSWWKQNRHRPRGEWLIDGLLHRDLDVRASAIDELVRLANDTFGYDADGSRHDRERAADRWRDWWIREGRMRLAIAQKEARAQ